VVVVEAAGGVRRHERIRRGVPGAVRRGVLAACGVALVGGLAQPSYAGSGHRGLAGLPLPDRAVAPRHGGPADHRAPPPEAVVVRPGDTLWAISARGLPPDSPAATIASRWHVIYATNRSLIGSDPDVIVPGQRLLLPGKESS
jgi:nucleoid-associated protein YgaU